MKVAVIGDNCIDVYKNLNIAYPTGNVVDTGVNLRQLGAEVSIISTTGNDDYGRQMIETLERVGLDISHLKVSNGKTAVTYMDMDGNERVHGDYHEGVLSTMNFDEEDLEFADTHDFIHTALWGKAESILPRLKSKNCRISFDYADRLDHPLVEETLPYVEVGFYSYHQGHDLYIESFLKDKVNRGMKIAVATFGDKGSLAYDGVHFYKGDIYPTEVVNTVGAGDSFISGFLFVYLNGGTLSECLDLGAKVASKVVSVFKPWVG